ncbi:MAG: Na/Pi cotransporter family protein [Clostridiales bacterium]|nr:Na/Pi cotransporter family protein [Clostridiales bacterium]
MELFTSVLALLSGLAIFMYSMKMTSGGLEAVAGNKLKGVLQKLTDNRLKGVGVGAGVTALIQSSTAVTVMVIGFVNAGLLNLHQALWVIMGANIGTNITSQLIAFDIGEFAPILAVIGVFVVIFARNKKFKSLGEIVTGLGFIFISMNIMKDAMAPYATDPRLTGLLQRMDNPLLGILVGIIFVNIISSSAAAVGVLQALAMAAAGSGAIDLEHAMYIIMGFNIGTCVTALLSSIGTTKMASRAALMHLFFNVIGTLIFTVAAFILPIAHWVELLSPNDVARQLANFHLVFNVVGTLILLPAGDLIVKLVNICVPGDEAEKEGQLYLQYLTPAMLRPDFQIAGSGVYITAVTNEVKRMLDKATENVSRSLRAVLDNNDKIQQEINEQEEYVDYLNKEISYYISHCLTQELTEEDALTYSALFKITGNIERMGDHATNIAGYANMLQDKGLKFSEYATAEVESMIEIIEKTAKILSHNDGDDIHIRVAKAEQKIDDMTDQYRLNQLDRMKTGVCSGEACVIYSEMLTDFERLGDHMLNIAEAQEMVPEVVTAPARKIRNDKKA